METTLVIVLTLNSGKKATLKIANPKQGITRAEAMKVVADIIGKNAMDFNGALVAGCEKVYLSKLDTEILA